MIARRAVVAFALALGASPLACGASSDSVTRLVDGRTVVGPFVPGDAYAAFLRGAIAEEQGRLGEALAAYDQVLAIDPTDPEPWARAAAVRCAMRANDPEGARAAERALALDPDYGPAHLALARCGVDPRASLERAARAEPLAPEPQLWLARLDGGAGDDAKERDRLLAMGLAEPSAAGLAALGDWAAVHGAPQTAVAAWIAACRRDARRADDALRRAAQLAGDGEIGAARALAGALVDLKASGRGEAGPIPDLVRRLAVDDALARGDADTARRRAVAARVDLDELAGRAILLGHPEVALPVAELVAAADPSSVSARLALAAASEALGRPSSLAAPAQAGAAVPPSVRLAWARAIARRLGEADAVRAVRAVPGAGARAGDAVEVTVAVELAARGLLVGEELPLDGRVELTIRNRGAFPKELVAVASDALALDPRHRLALLAWTSPAGPDTTRLAARLTRSGSRDPLVVASVLHIAAATKSSPEPALRDRLLASAPADPIVCAAGVEVAPSEQSKRRLAVVAATKAERELATY